MHMNKWSTWAAAVTLVGLAGSAQAERTLTYGSYLASSHATNVTSVEPWIAAVEAQTDGSIKINLFADGTVVGAKDAVAGVRDGLVDMAMIVDFYAAQDLASSSLMTELGLLGSDEAAMIGAVNEMQLLNCPSCQAEAAENNMKMLGLYAASPYHFICNKEFPTLESLKGARVKASGPWAQFATALGATPVNIPSSEMYEGMQRGQIDCSLINIPALTNYSLHEVASYVIDLPVGTFNGGHVYNINTGVWEDLTDVEKAAMQDNIPAALAGLVEGAIAETDNARRIAEESGVVFAAPDPALVKFVETYRTSEMERVTALGESRGIEAPGEMLNTFRELITKWEGIVDETGGDKAQFEQALKTHIFDKVE